MSSDSASPTTAQPPAPAGAAAESAVVHAAALPAILGGLFMTILDFSIVNVAIPSMQTKLHASAAEIQFVVAGYGLTYGAGLITGGRLGDRFGRRRVYMIGLFAFVLASAACGFAPNAVSLVVGRLVQGAAASLLFPQVLSILNVTYTGPARARAFNWYGLVLGTAWVGGQVLGGVLIKANLFNQDWRTCFLINLPLGAATLLVTRFSVTESKSATARRLDLRGVALVTVGLVLLVYPLIEGREAGWPLWAFISMVVSLPVLWLFLRWQSTLSAQGGTPLVEPTLLRSRSFLLGISTVFATYASMASFFLVFAVYIQEGEGYDALGSGVAFLPLGITFFVVSLQGKRIAARLGHYSISAGAVVLAVGEVVLGIVALALGGKVNAWELAGPLAVVGIGMGMVLAPLISRALSGVDPNHAGSAAGMLSTMQQVGNSVGVALIGVIFYGLVDTHAVPGVTYAHAFAGSMIYSLVLAALVGVMAMLLPRPPAAPAG
jgi:EmrB/QacA subfamily drug resistance transporter